MQTGYWVVVWFHLFTLTIKAAPTPETRSDLDSKLKEHINRTARFQCREPQLRSYKIKDHLSSGALKTSEKVLPAFTVVHRCDSGTGCCGGAGTCAPKEKTEILVAIRVTDDVNKTESVIRMMKVENHTSCGCSSSQSEVPPPVMTLV